MKTGTWCLCLCAHCAAACVRVVRACTRVHVHTCACVSVRCYTRNPGTQTGCRGDALAAAVQRAEAKLDAASTETFKWASSERRDALRGEVVCAIEELGGRIREAEDGGADADTIATAQRVLEALTRFGPQNP